MPRDASSPELSSPERTALWVQAQASFAQTYVESSPPSPARSSAKTSSSYRTTTSTDNASVKPFLADSSSMQQSTRSRPPAPVTSSSTSAPWPRYDSRARRSSLPFPQSPPGSGYPIPLEVAAPRRQDSEDRQTTHPQTPMARSSLRKERRPSLIDHIISFTPGQRCRTESEKRKRKA